MLPVMEADRVAPISEHTEGIFDGELVHQSESLSIAVNTMNQSLAQQSSLSVFWFALDAALGALGNMSKVFWPSGSPKLPLTLERCAHMRRIYQLTDDSLLNDRAVRNGFEHFDERIDSWHLRSERHNFVDRMVGGPADIIGLDDSDFARLFDPSTKQVRVMGDAVDFQALVSEAELIGRRARERQEARWRRPWPPTAKPVP